jgi:crotonobetainyl-CoA:carnitine CoA-transferase CaiB-like acyl-CoA transferase
LGTDDVRQLGGIPDLADLVDLDSSGLEVALEKRLAQKPMGYWLPPLQAADIGAQPVRRIEALMQDPWVREHRLSVTQTIEHVGEMTMPGVAPRMSRTPLRIGAPVRPPGDDAPAVLESIGISDRLEALLQAGAITMTHAPSLA